MACSLSVGWRPVRRRHQLAWRYLQGGLSSDFGTMAPCFPGRLPVRRSLLRRCPHDGCPRLLRQIASRLRPIASRRLPVVSLLHSCSSLLRRAAVNPLREAALFLRRQASACEVRPSASPWSAAAAGAAARRRWARQRAMDCESCRESWPRRPHRHAGLRGPKKTVMVSNRRPLKTRLKAPALLSSRSASGLVAASSALKCDRPQSCTDAQTEVRSGPVRQNVRREPRPRALRHGLAGQTPARSSGGSSAALGARARAGPSCPRSLRFPRQRK
mmetsp:Transcript_27354/g.48834  ORF Transcript_27354/g.48834 Transcript_27354/m.48834 type:complete len:273 (+) Transcript_27354:2179-2997(+)